MSTRVFKGWQAKIYIHDLEIGSCKSVNVEYSSPVEPYYELENPNMVQVTSVDQFGLIDISGSITKAWMNIYYLKLLIGGVGGAQLTVPNFEFDMRLFASPLDGNSPVLYLYQCRFKKGTINIPANGWIEESFDFIANSAGTELTPSFLIHLTSHCTNAPEDNNGTILLHGFYTLPSDATVTIADYITEFSIGIGNHFLNWERTGGITLDNLLSNHTIAHVTGAGTLNAVYEKILHPCPGGEQIINGGFETGLLLPWFNIAGGDVYVIDDPYEGVYSVELDMKYEVGEDEWTTPGIRQTLVVPTPFGCIQCFRFVARGEGDTVPILNVVLHYQGGGSLTTPITLTDDWVVYNMLDEIDPHPTQTVESIDFIVVQQDNDVWVEIDCISFSCDPCTPLPEYDIDLSSKIFFWDQELVGGDPIEMIIDPYELIVGSGDQFWITANYGHYVAPSPVERVINGGFESGPPLTYPPWFAPSGNPTIVALPHTGVYSLSLSPPINNPCIALCDTIPWIPVGDIDTFEFYVKHVEGTSGDFQVIIQYSGSADNVPISVPIDGDWHLIDLKPYLRETGSIMDFGFSIVLGSGVKITYLIDDVSLLTVGASSWLEGGMDVLYYFEGDPYEYSVSPIMSTMMPYDLLAHIGPPHIGERIVKIIVRPDIGGDLLFAPGRAYGLTFNEGTIAVAGSTHSLPETISEPYGDYSVLYDSGINTFDYWEVDGGVTVEDDSANPTVMHVTADGSLVAVAFPNVICPSGEQIVNGGFETGDFTGWSVGGSLFVTTDAPYEGLYCARSYSNGSVYQILSEPVPVSCVDEDTIFSVAIKSDYGFCPAGGGEFTVEIGYTDDSYTTVVREITYPEQDVWQVWNLKPHLVPGKTIKSVMVSGNISWSNSVCIDAIKFIL
jgi:hypothetical protein